ncbi:MAG: DUF736 domain-containing protein [Candidatus Micrarchaeia archaeon]|jgi:hypothetical protein
MAYEQKNNSGVLFGNDKKTKDNHPDYKGNACIEGKIYWISGWKKKGKSGTFLSLALTEKQDRPQSEQPAAGGEDISF